jgi:hypothetical protein
LPDAAMMDSTPVVRTTRRGDTVEQFAGCWEGLEDPRSGNAGLHDFHELLMIALCTVLCGGQGAVDMAEFAKAKEPFLRGFLRLANGAPSHDTFSRLFRQLDPAQFRTAFQRFMARSLSNVRVLWPLTGRFYAARSIEPARSRRCTWSAPGVASNAWSWRRSPPTPSRTRSPHSDRVNGLAVFGTPAKG